MIQLQNGNANRQAEGNPESDHTYISKQVDPIGPCIALKTL
jgi:hypothetical protein